MPGCSWRPEPTLRILCRGAQEPRQLPERCAVVVARHTVGTDHPAAAAALEQGHLPALADPEADGVHEPRAEAAAIAYDDIDVEAPQAVGTVVPLARAGRLARHGPTAVAAEEGLAGPVRGGGVLPGA
jgi:hypothetical protein